MNHNQSWDARARDLWKTVNHWFPLPVQIDHSTFKQKARPTNIIPDQSQICTEDVIDIPDGESNRKYNDTTDHGGGDEGDGRVILGKPANKYDIAEDPRYQDDGES